MGFAWRTGAAEAIGAVDGFFRTAVWAREGVRGAGDDWDLGAAGDVEDVEGVTGGLLDFGVAVDGGDADYLQLGAGQAEEEGHGVVHAGVGVKDYLLGHGRDCTPEGAGGRRRGGAASLRMALRELGHWAQLTLLAQGL